ncbi:MAG TPA: DNA-directed RNA polymerase subunit beta, partial [Chloroflexota bacterium]|nr:DNA-directed RNA polymerase subunit beta [Chloroflexota bacterium]
MTIARPSTSLATVDGGGRLTFARIADVMQIPNLIQVQRDSFKWFKDEGLKELFAEISPIQDFTGRNLELAFEDYWFDDPKYSELECRERDMTYAAPLRVRARLTIKPTGEIKKQDIFMGDFPLMTEKGTFIINGAERVVVSQLVRSPGVYFTLEEDASSGRSLCMAKLIPNRGAWLEFETSNRNVMTVKVDRKRKIPVTTLLRAIGHGADEKLVELYEEVDVHEEHRYIHSTIEKDVSRTTEEALLEFYRKLRPGDPPNPDNAKNLMNSLFFNFRRYDLGKVGRYKLNKRLGLDIPMTERVLTPRDLTEIIKRMIQLNNGQGRPDDIDHLGNRRVRAVGELIQNQFRVGLLRMERVIKERMTIQEAD